MLFENILVPYDGSEHAAAALKMAVKIVSDDPEAKVHIINVIATSDLSPRYGKQRNPFWRPYDSMGESTYAKMMKEARDSALADMSADIKPTLDVLGDKAAVEIVTSAGTAEGIAEYAANHDCDLIVMGRRGLGAIRGMLGSVSFSVLSESDVPVLVVK